jgi:hypothetical protein
MSVHSLEKALFDIASAPPEAQRYRVDPDAYLARYRLDAEEARLIKVLDVRELIARDINPMLVMRAFTSLEGRASLPEYLRRLQADSPRREGT